MTERALILFNSTGKVHTEHTLKAAQARAVALDIHQVVVATTSGSTALKAVEIFSEKCSVVGVHLAAGLWQKYGCPDRITVEKAKAKGAVFVTATHALMGNVGTSLREKLGVMDLAEVIAHTYYTFGQGMKVAVEVSLMAADAGLLDMDQECIAIAGTGEGADTAIVVKPAFTVSFFDLRIREIIAMPR